MFSDVSIYLASASPQRRALLDRLGVSYQCCPMSIDETPEPKEDIVTYVTRMAEEKAAAAQKYLGEWAIKKAVLAADTAIGLEGEIFGKPKNRGHARQILQCLSDRTHRVVTALALHRKDYADTAVSDSQVTFTPIPDALIERYLDTEEYLNRAGAYAVQGAGEVFVAKLEGSFSGVMGLPLSVTLQLFVRAGLWHDND